jgi:hypothetical protein
MRRLAAEGHDGRSKSPIFFERQKDGPEAAKLGLSIGNKKPDEANQAGLSCSADLSSELRNAD